MVAAYQKCEGVSKADVDFAKKTATISYDETKTKEETLLAVLKDTKYKATKQEEKKDAK